MASDGFAARVMLSIEQESRPAVLASKRSHWLRWSTGGAIAASVAAAALMIVQPAGDSERVTTAAVSPAGPSRSVAEAEPTAAPTAPAAVPPWLSGNSAGLLSQQASATLGAPFGRSQATVYPRRLSNYPSAHRYRTLDNRDGSYLLLLDPDQQPGPTCPVGPQSALNNAKAACTCPRPSVSRCFPTAPDPGWRASASSDGPRITFEYTSRVGRLNPTKEES